MSEWKWPNKARTQVVWWFPEWCGVRLFRWGGASACMFRWSLALGFVEFRRWRPWSEAKKLFAIENDRLLVEFGASVERREHAAREWDAA